MLIRDEETQKSHKRQEEVDSAKETSRQAAADNVKRETDTLPLDGGIDTSNPEAQRGRPMMTEAVIAKLKAMNPSLHFEVGANSVMASNFIGIYQIIDGKKKYIGIAMERWWMPEFSVRMAIPTLVPNPDIADMLPIKTFEREVRGWRTVLARLIRARLITKEDAEKNFDIAGGRSSFHWQALTGGTND